MKKSLIYLMLLAFCYNPIANAQIITRKYTFMSPVVDYYAGKTYIGNSYAQLGDYMTTYASDSVILRRVRQSEQLHFTMRKVGKYAGISALAGVAGGFYMLTKAIYGHKDDPEMSTVGYSSLGLVSAGVLGIFTSMGLFVTSEIKIQSALRRYNRLETRKNTTLNISPYYQGNSVGLNAKLAF